MGSQGAHRNSVNCLSEIQSPDNCADIPSLENPSLVSSGADNLVKVWDVRKLKVTSEFTVANVSKVAWFHRCVVTGSSTGTMTLWELQDLPTQSTHEHNPARVWTPTELTAHTQTCTDIVSNKHCVASASNTGLILRWNASQ
jgi:WD40 repeat protein